MKTKFIIIALVLISFLSLFVNLYKKNSSPPCFNTDEAAFGYNAYSLLKTARDEYGSLFPLRLKSFGDYKMPLYSYLSVPFIATFGLNETSTRALNTTVAFLFPTMIYLLTVQFFGKRKYGLLAALLFTLTPAVQTIGRQAHEAYLSTFLICLSLWLLLKILQSAQNRYKLFFLLSLILLSFGYQFSRLWIGLFMIPLIWFAVKKKISLRYLLLCFLTFFLILIPDLIVRPERVNNLLFFNNAGLGLQTAELRSEGGNRVIYNKLTVGVKNFLYGHLKFYSPQFLVITGDENQKFAYPGISPIAITEYIFIFVGLYFLFKDNQRYKLFLVFFLFCAPLAASLSWAGTSVTRSLPLIVFTSILSSYGFLRFVDSSNRNTAQKGTVGILILSYFALCFYSWDFYFNHYSKRAVVIRSWQCGNKEMALYIKNSYQDTNKFYITNKNSEPYIFTLFYLAYPPEKYQKQAQLSKPDDFGFGQVEQYDKFNFQFHYDPQLKNTVFIGYPEDFNGIVFDKSKVKKIVVGTETIFWTYKSPSK